MKSWRTVRLRVARLAFALTMSLCLGPRARAGVPAAPVPLSVRICAAPGQFVAAVVPGWTDAVRARGVGVEEVWTGGPCEATATDAGSADLTVEALPISQDVATLVRTRMSLGKPEAISLRIHGRPFTVDLVSRHADFPGRAPEPMSASDALLPEAAFLQGIVQFKAYRRIHADRTREGRLDGADAREDDLRGRALALLDQADSRHVEYLTPTTSALIKQLRAIIILDGACSEDTASGLLRAAARLVAHDANARAAAALGRLAEVNSAQSCTRTTEKELLSSVMLDLWNQGRVQDLGQFYELSLNAASNATSGPREGGNEVTALVAQDRLKDAWGDHPPESPHMLEMGIGTGLATSSDGDLVRRFAPLARVDFTFGRDGPGIDWRVGATLPWTREVQVEPHSASWIRLAAAAGPRYRDRYTRFYWEIAPALVLAPVFVSGHDFDENYRSVGLDGGANLGTRVGTRWGETSLWLGVGVDYFFAKHIPGWPDLSLRAHLPNGEISDKQLPEVDFLVTLGVSRILWR
jgi:hypothetical protein